MTAIGEETPAVAREKALAALSEKFALRALRIALGAGSVVSLAVLLVAVADPGPHPVTRRLLSALFALAWLTVFAFTRRVARTLRRRPMTVVAVGAAAVVPLTLDGGYHSILAMELWPLAAVAAITARPRTALACGIATGLAYVLAVLLTVSSAGSLVSSGRLYETATTALNGVFTAGLFVALVASFRTITQQGGARLEAVRAGGPATSPALGRFLRAGAAPLLLLPRNPIPAPLTPAERRVIDELGSGKAAKQIAYEQDRSVHTIRTQIKSAKRKTGARTLEELVAIAWAERDG